MACELQLNRKMSDVRTNRCTQKKKKAAPLKSFVKTLHSVNHLLLPSNPYFSCFVD